MNKRTFLKLSSTALVTPMLSPSLDWLAPGPMTNWAGNYEYGTDRLEQAKSVQQVQELIRKHPNIKVLGTRHCFNGIADSTQQFINLGDMNQVVSLDANAQIVTVDATMKYGDLAIYLDQKGFALHNLASLPHISVAGACATATHGSGVNNGNLATAVVGMDFVTAAGEKRTLTEAADGEAFRAAVVHLGGLGVVTHVTLRIQPTFQVRQHVYENLPMSQIKAHFDAIMSAGYSVSLFTDWQKGLVSEVWVKSRVEPSGTQSAASPDFYGAKPATRNLHPIAALDAVNCTAQMGVPGPWYERLPHFRMGFTPSSGKELQSEYFVPASSAVEALLAVERLRDQVTPHLMISEIRTIAADNLWMSPAYKRPSVAIHFTWKPDWVSVKKVLPVIEKELAAFGARPHWGKLFTIPPAQLQARYERHAEFKQMLAQNDPKGKFRNAFLNTNIFS